MDKFAVQPVLFLRFPEKADVTANDSDFDESCWTWNGVVLPRS